MKPRCIAVLILIAASPLFAQATFDKRRDWLLARDWTTLTSNGEPSYGGPKNGVPYALVHLYRSNGTDPEALQYVSQVLLYSMLGNHFEPVGVVRAVHEYWSTSPRTRARRSVRARSFAGIGPARAAPRTSD